VLKLSSVVASYGKIDALKGVSLVVREGEIVALIGANGAGKSTTLMTISGALRPQKGTILFYGDEIAGYSPHDIVHLGISQVPEGRRIFPHMTVRENLEMGGFLRTREEVASDIDRVYGFFPTLAERSRQPGGTLSGGEQQMLAIGRALMARPRFLLLDEPSLGLAPIIVSKIFKIIREINEQGTTILLVEQNAKAALRLADRAYVMESGTIAMHGEAGEIADDPGIKKAYLGE
jgi:branched-chain amino acid transport system ATP-binding protein